MPSNRNVIRQLPDTQTAKCPARPPDNACSFQPGTFMSCADRASSRWSSWRRSFAAWSGRMPALLPVSKKAFSPSCGMQPDGTGGYPTVRWDMTTWHNYEVYGDIFNIGSDGSGPGFDLPTYCKARYRVPFLLTEWNTGPEKTEAYRATYISSRYASYFKARKTKNIQSVMYYDLDSGDGLMIDGAILTQPYGAFTSFIAGHPDT